MKVQFGREAKIIAPFDQIVGALLRLEGGFRQLEILPIRSQGQIRVGDRGNQQDLRAAAGLLGGQVILQGLIFQAADAAEEVDFPGGDAEIDTVVVRSSSVPGSPRHRRESVVCSRCRWH